MNRDSLETKIEDTQKTKGLGKIKEWLYRYGPAEIIGTVAAYTSFFLVQDATDSNIAAAYAGTIGENVGFYGTMIIRETASDMKDAKRKGQRYGPRKVVKTAAKLISEFGAAEALDSFVIRPATMGLGSKYLGREVGVMAGKIVADIGFYISTIASYELRQSISKRNKRQS